MRDYQYSADDVKNDKAQFESLDQEKRKTYPILFKWLKVNFTEAYSAWMHIKVSFHLLFDGNFGSKILVIPYFIYYEN